MALAGANVWCCSLCGAIYHKDFPRCPNDGAEIVKRDTDPLVNTQIDHYIIDSIIGEGGMGRVYRAHHTSLSNKQYAIKVLLGDVAATASMRKRFVKEAEIASKLEHPNLVSVLDFGSTPTGLPYIVMEFIDGEVLTDILDRAPIDPSRVVRIARAVAEGVAYLHEAGLVHRDLKPDNILIVRTPEGEVPRLTDFGLALVQDAQSERLTSTGMAMGTPAYAAPEQMGGKVVDARADIYALGMTMYEMLTGGILPWEGNALEIATVKAHRDAPLLRQRKPDLVVPDALEQLIALMLRRRPDERPQTTREVIAALAAIDRNEERAVTRRKPRWWIPAAAVLALAGGAVAFAWRGGPRASGLGPPENAQVARIEPVPTPSVPSPPSAKDTGSSPEARGPKPEAPAEAPAEAPSTKAPARTSSTGRRRHHERHAPTTSSVIVERPAPPPAVDPQPVASLALAPALPAPPPIPPPPPVLHAVLAGVDVHGSLPRADVERAVRRAMPAITRCIPTSAEQITAQLEIGESRRARDVQASGGTSASCVAAALGAVRTEAAPDVGDVTVVVHVRFVDR